MTEEQPQVFHCGVDRLGALREPDERILSVVEKIKDKIKEKAPGKTVEQVKTLGYKVVIGFGTFYFTKVQINGDEVLHLKIHQNYTDPDPQLEEIVFGKSINDEIERF